MDKSTELTFVDRRDNTDGPQTLLKYLELRGNLVAHTSVQMQKSHKYYVRAGWDAKRISREVGVDSSIISKWALLFGWDEERDAVQYAKWRKVAGIAKSQGIDVDARADRIMATIEEAAEMLLHQHKDAVEAGDDDGRLKAAELATLATCIKTTHSQRTTLHGTRKKEDVKKVEVAFSGNVDILHRIGAAAADAARQMPQIEAARAAHELDPGQVEDAEFEVVDDGGSDVQGRRQDQARNG